MSIGFWQIALIAVVVVLLFGRGKISELMGDVAKGITSFKKGLKDDGDEAEQPIPENATPEERKAIADKRAAHVKAADAKVADAKDATQKGA
ncbi:hypothetical protein GCM10007972_00590 [Iodidimonas muriae]|uniref:Sec-independent protein translocase protein TatA n=1 Tax=Iodidimonas muriae TaxID=261467 RepID=A0ABQ2L7Q9_9PROT|nr:twin-arginine translocase TatA/TatE family subunit [Iodidimonas muriae]GER06324.1 hypothetical protein JCM17843_06340 [Kordiimonadales bacterium JCM 17843]GGO04316.1 hypothetical protein GCM10007972_00590 [Iodidimonas muriae]